MQILPLPDFSEHIDTVTRWIWEQWPETTSTLEDRRERLMLVDECPAPLVAVLGNEPAGVLGFRRHRRKDAVERVLFIDAVYVHAAFRERGVGSALLAEAVRVARDFEPEVFVFTDKRDWYEKRGWSLVEIASRPNHVVLKRAVT